MDTIQIVLTMSGSVLASSALFTFIQFLISRYDKRHNAIVEMQKAMEELKATVEQLQTSINENNEEMQKQSEALQATAQDRIIFLSKKYIDQGYISIDDHSTLSRIANSYFALNGNGRAKEYYMEVEKLPRK